MAFRGQPGGDVHHFGHGHVCVWSESINQQGELQSHVPEQGSSSFSFAVSHHHTHHMVVYKHAHIIDNTIQM